MRASIVGNVTVLHEDPTEFPNWPPNTPPWPNVHDFYPANSTQAIEIQSNSPGLDREELQDYLLANAGSRPTNRDVVDARMIEQIEERTFRDWLDSPAEYSSLPGHSSDGYPTETGSHTLDIPNALTRQNDPDGNGYTILEEWLHARAAAVESGAGGGPLDPAGTVLDNFEDGNATGWTASGTHSWSVVPSGGGDVYRQSNLSADARAILAGSNWTDQVIQADIKITAVDGSDRWAGVFGRYTDVNNHYYLVLRHGTNTVQLRKKVATALTTLDSAAFTVNLNTTYTLRLVIDGTSLTGYVNGVNVVSAIDNSLASGSVAVGTYKAQADVNNVYASSNPIPTAAFGDDFQDGNATGWSPVGATSWAVIHNGSSYVYEQDDMSGGAAAYAGDLAWTNQTVQMDLRITDTLDSVDRWAGPVARYTNDNNYYYMTLRETGTIELKKIQGGAVSVLDSASFTFSHANVYDVKLEVIGTTINGYLGGQLVLEAQDAGSTVAAGRAGVRMFKAAVQVDEVLVTRP